jgi:hypothetical protein
LNIEEHKNIVRSFIYLVQDHTHKQWILKVITIPKKIYILIGWNVSPFALNTFKYIINGGRNMFKSSFGHMWSTSVWYDFHTSILENEQ